MYLTLLFNFSVLTNEIKAARLQRADDASMMVMSVAHSSRVHGQASSAMTDGKFSPVVAVVVAVMVIALRIYIQQQFQNPKNFVNNEI